MVKTTNVKIKVFWRERSASLEYPLRGLKVTGFLSGLISFPFSGFLDREGCLDVPVPDSLLDSIKKNKNVTILIFPQTKDITVIYRENTRDKANAVGLQSTLNVEKMEVKFVFNLSKTEGKSDPADPTTELIQFDRRRLIVGEIAQFGADYTRNELKKEPDNVTIYYPMWADKLGLSMAGAKLHIVKNSYNDVDTILHEYGHKVYRKFVGTAPMPVFIHSSEIDLSVL